MVAVVEHEDLQEDQSNGEESKSAVTRTPRWKRGTAIRFTLFQQTQYFLWAPVITDLRNV